MVKEKITENLETSEKKSKVSDDVIKQMTKNLIFDLNAGRWDYIERWNDYLNRLDGAEKFPDSIAFEMIKAWRWDEVLRHIDKFEPTQKLANALLKDMIKMWFYEDKDARAEGYNFINLLEDNIVERENFLSYFWNLDKSTALLALELLNKNMFVDADSSYKEHLGDCFNIKYFTGLDEEVLIKISDLWKVIPDEDKNRFVWINDETREKYTNIALKVQEEASKINEKIEKEMKEEYSDEEFDEIKDEIYKELENHYNL